MVEEAPGRAENTRDEIIQAAHDLFIQQGYHGTSMRQIARNADLALGGLYNHFNSKEGVFHAVFQEYHPYREVLPAILNAQGQSIEELIRDAADKLVQALENRPDFMNILFIEMVEFGSVHTSELFTIIFPYALQIAQKIAEVGTGKLRPIPPPILIRTFLGLFFSYYMTEAILGNVAPPEFSEGAMDYFVDIFLHGILKRDQMGGGV